MKTACATLSLLLWFSLAVAPGESSAQSYPSKPIKFVVGFQPGGSTDILARIVSQKLAERLGQPITVENKPGADAIIAAEYVQKAAPDGYTLFVGGTGVMVFNPGLHERLPYDPVNDFIAITLFASNPLVFAVHPSVPATTLKELIALAKAKPGGLFYGSGASAFQVAAELFKREAGVNIVHVPFKGSGPSVTAGVAGEVAMVAVEMPAALAQLRAGKLRALAVTSRKRYGIMPDIPTMEEAGLANFVLAPWTGLFAPAATPSAVIDKLYGSLSIVLNEDSVKERFASLGMEGGGMPPAQFSAILKADLAKWSKATRELNVRAK